ncbi:hypothetical protein F66182_12948, partial [Fusarium sp. NRRL 66182]
MRRSCTATILFARATSRHSAFCSSYLRQVTYFYRYTLRLQVKISQAIEEMADIRSMLRNELASRGSSAQSGSTGRVTKKRKIEEPDAIQPAHKKSRPTTPSYTREDDESNESANSDQRVAEQEEGEVSQDEEAGPHLPDNELSQQQTPTISNAAQTSITEQNIDENEWAAFEREVVAPTRAAPTPAAVAASSSAATISAATISAATISAAT